MRRTRKPAGVVPLKSKGERASEIGERGRREVKHYRGKKAELGKRSLKTQQMTSGSGSAAGNATRSPHRRRRRDRKKDGADARTEGKKATVCIPVSSSKGSTWLCLEMKGGVADSEVGWRFAVVPHCKAAVPQSRL